MLAQSSSDLIQSASIHGLQGLSGLFCDVRFTPGLGSWAISFSASTFALTPEVAQDFYNDVHASC
jgi:hypothetical protein